MVKFRAYMIFKSVYYKEKDGGFIITKKGRLYPNYTKNKIENKENYVYK